jgi:23S rRNA (cytosine1962-C5)-methyltransferase
MPNEAPLSPELQHDYQQQAAMLANKVKKQYRHLRKRFAKQQITVFRLYDWEIPEIRAVVDWYGGHLVIGEYTRKQSTPQWLPIMGNAVARALEVPPEKVHLKQRYYGAADGNRYQRIAHTNQMIVVTERDLQFYVNPRDYVDTGLFADHRNTRQMVREASRGKHFLNLFCYTGTFSCYAAKGGAHTTTSVDRSQTAIAWTRRNMALNAIGGEQHRTIQTHVFDFLSKAEGKTTRYDLAVVDPPSFYTQRSREDHFDIVRDHPELLNAVIRLMRPGATIWFSSNHQQFTPQMAAVKASEILEITRVTIPEDYIHKRKQIHRCWRITV